MNKNIDVFSQKIIDEIDVSFQNRIRELIDFFNFLISDKSKENSDNILETLQKSYILLLYANWEGFIKECSITYFSFIISKKEKINNLKDNFYIIYFKDLLKNYKVNRDIKIEKSILEQLFNKNKKFSVKLNEEHFLKYILGTEDNLKLKNYQNICELINYSLNDPHNLFEVILTKLVHNRNSIAHTGIKANDNTYSDINDIEQMKNLILKEMENFKDYIISSIIEKKYLA